MKSSNSRPNSGTEIRQGFEVRPYSSDNAGEIGSDDSLLLLGDGMRCIGGVYGVESHCMDADEDFAVTGLGSGELPDGDVFCCSCENEGLHCNCY